MAFEAGDYGRDEDETLAEARERSGRAAGVGSGGNGGGAWGWDRWMGRALAAVYGTYSSGGKTSIIGKQAAVARAYMQLQQEKTNRTNGITDTSPSGYSSM